MRILQIFTFHRWLANITDQWPVMSGQFDEGASLSGSGFGTPGCHRLTENNDVDVPSAHWPLVSVHSPLCPCKVSPSYIIAHLYQCGAAIRHFREPAIGRVGSMRKSGPNGATAHRSLPGASASALISPPKHAPIPGPFRVIIPLQFPGTRGFRSGGRCRAKTSSELPSPSRSQRSFRTAR